MIPDPVAVTSRQSEGKDRKTASSVRLPVARYDLVSVTLHWLVAVITSAQLFLAWHLVFGPQAHEPAWKALFRLHVTMGLGLALLVVAMLIWRGFHSAPDLTQSVPRWQRSFGRAINVLLYGALLLAPFSGYMAEEFAARPMSHPGLSLPVWGWDDPALHYLFVELHRASVWGLAGAVGMHIGVVIGYARRYPGVIVTMLPSGRRVQGALALPVEQLAEMESRRLARRFRIFGWILFLLEVLLSLVTLLLLAVATSSSHYSVKDAADSPGALGACASAMVLLVTILAFFYCTRIARALMSRAGVALSRQRLVRFLGLLIFTGFVGMALALMGAASSIALLIAKTITQPPGIAITDPSRIIRALDVFILLANFVALTAHFIGAFFSLWLMMYTFRHTRLVTPAAEDADATDEAVTASPRSGDPEVSNAPEPGPAVQRNTS